MCVFKSIDKPLVLCLFCSKTLEQNSRCFFVSSFNLIEKHVVLCLFPFQQDTKHWKHYGCIVVSFKSIEHPLVLLLFRSNTLKNTTGFIVFLFKLVEKQLVLFVYVTFEFDIGIDSYVFFISICSLSEIWGRILSNPKSTKNIVITVTVGQQNEIRKILKVQKPL